MSNKTSTRQKMINMMYLLLTAILALNVSSEILKSFFLMEISMARAGENADRKIGMSMQMFDSSMKHFPEKTAAFYGKALTAKQEMNGFINYVEMLKHDLEAVAGSRLENGELKDAENFDKPTRFFLTEGRGAQLKSRINELRMKLTGLLDPADQQGFRPALQADNPAGNALSWEENLFNQSPAAACMVILEKLQNDARNSTDDVINKLRASVTKNDVTFNKFSAQVIPSSRYVMLGEEFTAQIVLAAMDTLNKYEVLVGNTPVPQVDGRAQFRLFPSREGNTKYEGTIITKDKAGKTKELEFSREFYAARPSVTIAATAMNTFYTGLDNPVSVSVPGVKAEDIIVKATYGKLSGANGKYSIRLAPGQKKTYIMVSAKTPSGIRSMGSYEYHVRPLPLPAVGFGAIQGNLVSAQEVRAATMVHASLGQGFAFEGLTYRVTSYSFMHVSHKKGDVTVINVTGGAINMAIRDIYKKLASKDRIIIYDVNAIGPAGPVTITNGLMLHIK